MKSLSGALALAAMISCTAEARPRAGQSAATDTPAAATTTAAPAMPTSSPESVAQSVAPRTFGAPAKLQGEPVPVAAVLAQPEPYLGKVVKCEGKVARVCQAAGCWLELQAEGGGDGLRVPMANHAFFIPQDAVGQTAVIEGELKRRELPDAQKQHYKGEGMQAMGPLSLDATSVALR